jgi:hypothetical protein
MSQGARPCDEMALAAERARVVMAARRLTAAASRA